MNQLDDLDDDCLIQVLEWLSPRQLFKMQLVNKRMNRLAAVKMLVKIKVIEVFSSNQRFNKCNHLGNFVQNQLLNLYPKFNCYPRFRFDTSKEALFLNVLAKCAGVKSIDFSHYDLSGDLLLEVAKRCPELECLKVDGDYAYLISIDVWNQVLEQFGQRLVHFVKKDNCSYIFEKRTAILLKTVALKCANIKQVGWTFDGPLNSDFIEAMRMLPKSCWVKFKCFMIDVEILDDVVDELDGNVLDWPRLGLNRCLNRLSSLRFADLWGNDHDNGFFDGVDFSGLKKLSFMNSLRHQSLFSNNLAIDYLVASRFPQLKEFCIDASKRQYEDDFDALFRTMPSVKKLTLEIEFETIYLPELAIHHLKQLEIIEFQMNLSPLESEQANFLQRLGQYVEEIGSLNKLVVKIVVRDLDERMKWLEDGVEQLKQRQSRVAVELIV